MHYACPPTLTEAIRLLSDGPMRVLAGGTDLYPATTAPALSGPLLDLTAIPDLRGIRPHDGGLRIGATTTWSDIAEAALPPALSALQQAARQVGGRQIQNRGTIGGNLCNASPAADGVPPLLALDVTVTLVGPEGQRSLPLHQFITGPRRTALKAGEVLASIDIPAPALQGRSAFVKLGARSSLVISIAMAAARVTAADGHIAQIAMAIGSCCPVAIRLHALETSLQGAPLTGWQDRITPDALTALAPIDDIRASAAYRRDAAAELLRRAVQGCLQ